MQLRALLAFYHDESYRKRGGISILNSTLLEYKEFRNTRYNPNSEIVPWNLMKEKNEGIANWNKTMKPTAKDYRPFREANNWVEYKEGFLVTLDAQNLNHLINSGYVVIDLELDGVQQKYLYKVFKDNFLEHQAKVIIKKHAKDKDTRAIWKELCELYDDSITTSMSADAILAWLSSCKFKDANWNAPTTMGQCPNCGAASLTHQEGCDVCLNCGYSRCG